MALKFRRGTTAQKSGSLAFGEPYVNTTLGTLQIGGESGDITLLINSASQAISGSSLNITGNAKIDGNLTLGGNITIGDQTSDTVTVTANLSSSLIPSVTNAFDLGSPTKIWKDLYLSTASIKLVDGSGNVVNTITNENIVTTDSIASGSITLTNSLPAGTVSGSAQVVSILSSLNSYTGSNDTLNTLQTTRIDQLASSTASVNSKISQLETDSGSQNTRITTLESKATTLQTYTASVDTDLTELFAFSGSAKTSITDLQTKATTLQTYTASVDTKFSTLQTLTASVQSQISRIQESTASLNAFSASNANTSLNSFTSSINTTIKNKLDTDGVISGSSQVTLASTTGFTSYSSSVDSRILTEKGRVDAILLASDADKDSFAEIVSLINSVDTTNDNTFASFYTASVNRLNNLESTSGSSNISISNINSFTSSINTTIKEKLNVETVVSSSAQVVGILAALNTYTASNDTTNNTQNSRLDQLSTASGSAISRLTAVESETLNLELYTGSFATASVTLSNKTISGASNTLSNIGNSSLTNSSITIAGQSTALGGTITAETIRTAIGTVVTGSAQVVGILASLNTYTGSNDTTNTAQNSRLSRLEESTASLNAFSASENTKSETLRLYTASIDTKFTSLATYTGSNDTTNTTQNTRLSRIEESTSSLNTLTASLATTYEGRANASKVLVSGSSQVNFTQLSGISANIISGSTNSTNVNFTISTGSITANLIGGVVSGSSQITAGSTTNFATDVKTQLNSNTVVSGSSQVNFTQLAGISANIISSSSDTSNVDMIISGGSISANLYGGVVSGSAQVVGMLASLNTYTASNDTTNTTQNSRLDQLSTASGSAIGRLNNLESYSSSLKTAITVAGSDVTVNGNLTVSGTTTTVNSNTVNIGDNVIILNSDETGVPSQNSGIEVQRGTSTNAILVWDEANDYWEAGLSGSEVPLVTTTGTQTLTNKTISGASNTLSNIANESLTNSSVTVGSTTISLGASSTTLAGLTSVTSTGFTGALTGNASTATTLQTARTINGTSFNGSANITIPNLVSGSSQIDLTATTNYASGILTRLNAVGIFSGSAQVAHDSTTGYSANKHIDHTAVSITAGSGLSGGGDISATRTLSIATGGVTDSMLAGSISNAKLTNSSITIAGQSTALGSSVTAETIRTAIGTVVTGSSQIDLTATTNYASGILTRLNVVGVFSGSSQVSHDSTTGYSANKHIDHTSVTLTAGSGLTGGGDISTNRTFAVGAGSYITVNADDVAVNTTTLIPAISGTILSSITGDVTITAGGVATIAANSVALGTDTTGNYVASLVAGTNITLSNNSGEGATPTIGLTNNAITIAGQSTSLGGSVTTETIRTAIGTVVTGSAQIAIASTSGFGTYINQAVLSTSSPTFAGLTINGSITATGDITAYYSSDKRFKDNVVVIEDALGKVKKLRGVKWEWNDEASEVTKAAPNTGLIAQEVQEVLPEVVKEREDGYLGLDYSKMVGLLVEAIKEQQTKIDNLSIEIANLKKQKGL